MLAATSVWPANRETINETLLPAGTWYLFGSTAGSAKKGLRLLANPVSVLPLPHALSPAQDYDDDAMLI